MDNSMFKDPQELTDPMRCRAGEVCHVSPLARTPAKAGILSRTFGGSRTMTIMMMMIIIITIIIVIIIICFIMIMIMIILVGGS